MKKLKLLIIASLLFVANSFAQITTNLIVSSSPPASLPSWLSQKQTIVYMVNGNSAMQAEYKIKTEIQLSDGTVIGKTDLTRSRIYVLRPGNTVYYADDVVPLENMIFTGKFREELNRSGKLPSQTYQICVTLVTSQEYLPLATTKCKVFSIATPILPKLLKPYKDQVLDAVEAQSVITFRWTPRTPVNQSVTTYKVLVFEVLQDQTPMQALRSNMPVLDQDVRGTTQYIWQPQGILNENPTDENGVLHQKQLIWTVQTFDNLGEQPLLDGSFNRDGVSEPVSFFIGNKRTPAKN